MKDRIAALLGSGLHPNLVATAVGCTPGYISQLLTDETFALEVSTLRVRDIEKLQGRDGQWNELEDTLLARLKELVPFMMKPRDVLGALQVVNGAKRRAAELARPEALNQQINIQNVVVLQLPQNTVNQFELSKNNEVISVEGRALVPMSTDTLLKELAASQTTGDQKALGAPNGDNRQTAAPDPNNLSPEIRERILSAEAV